MNSAIYECTIEHSRLEPKLHRFKYRHFLFCFDLSEFELLAKKFFLFSYNGKGIFDFRDSDFLYERNDKIGKKLKLFLQDSQVETDANKILLVAGARIFGYVFNPIAVYYLFDSENKVQTVIPEICNTFHEHKAYVIKNEFCLYDSAKNKQKKNFYISPFTDPDDDLFFDLGYPENDLFWQIKTIRKGREILVATLRGKRRELSDKELLRCLIFYPFSNFMVILGIHLHALLLWAKGLSFHTKEAFPELQTNILRFKNSEE